MSKMKKAKMKLSDYFRLSRISVKSRKKSTKNTVFGMSFGLILLIPMIFFAIAFYTDLSQQINSINTASALNVKLKNINDKSISTPYVPYTSGNEGQEGMPAFSDYYDLIDMPEVDDYILSEYAEISYAYQSEPSMKLEIGSDSHDLNFNMYSSGPSSSYYGISKMKIIYPNESSNMMFTNAELYDYKVMTQRTSPFINICNDGFTQDTNGKNEIILSEQLLNIWNIDKDEIANKTINILYPSFKLGDYLSYGRIDNDTNPNNSIPYPNDEDDEHQLYLAYQYKVVGIIRSDFYDLPGKAEESHFWVTAASVYYKEGRQDYKGIDYSINQDDEIGSYLTFEDNINIIKTKNIEQQHMLLLHSFFNRYTEKYSNTGGSILEYNNMNLTLQIKDFGLLANVFSNMKIMLKSAYSNINANDFAYLFSNELYQQFNVIDQIGKILIIVFSSVGGIIFFTNMLNLLNTVRYSVESRKNYIGVMRAIGAKSKVVPRLYICEMMIIFFKTFIWVTIFSTAISLGIKFGLDKGFEYLSSIVTFKINLIYFPITLGAVFVITTLIGILFAVISSKVTAYQPILVTLHDEK